MGLKDIQIKPLYNSDQDDTLNEFYVPALSNSIKYKRIAGYFSSNAFAIAAKGIAKFINNGGKMQLIANVVLSEEDQNAIKKALDVAQRNMIVEFENLEDELMKDHIKMLAWMVKNNLLEIKIAVVKRGIEHQKIGILEDSDGNFISFSGSENETYQAWINNDEQFHVFCSWEDGVKDHLYGDLNIFDSLWGNRANKVKVYDVSDAFTKGLIETAPKSMAEYERISKRATELLLSQHKASAKKTSEHSPIKLRDIQLNAVENWLKNMKRGIFEMATGTGKTFTALGCLNELLAPNESLLCIITCPYQHLVQQWRRSIAQFGIAVDNIIIADSSNYGWKDVLTDTLIDISLDHRSKAIVLTTHSSFSSKDFSNIMKKYGKDVPTLLIADEVHGIGAEKTMEGLIDEYQYRLGLSATPKRWLDEVGTKKIYEYFGDVVFEFPLEKAINTINPDTGKTYLVPYRYIPKFVSLNDEEIQEYINVSRAIVMNYSKATNDEEKGQILEHLLFKRSNIIKNASEKYVVLSKILQDLSSSINMTIVYCSPKQINNVMSIVNEAKIPSHRFTMSEGTSASERYHGLSERDYILKKFAEGNYKVLVAMKCLDEGVDVPPARQAILMASSGNPREYIQRIGRIIRRYDNKEEAVIYDIMVSVSKNLPKELKYVEEKIYASEMKRCADIARIALNNAEAMKLLYKQGEAI